MSPTDAFALLEIDPADAAGVLETMPPPEVLEPARRALAAGLANAHDNARPPSRAESKLFPAHLILATLGDIRACHRQFGIPDDISWKTLSHLGRAMRAYRTAHGIAGVEFTHWDWLRYFGWLYEVGRLEVTPYLLCTWPKAAGPLFWYEGEEAQGMSPGLRRGDPAISLHIPPTGELAPADCDAALQRLQTAFANRYPGMAPRIATCTSWLLDEQLAEYLPRDSNILSFQRRFRLVPGAQESDTSIVRALAGKGTTLERAAIEHIREGRHWHLRTGWLVLPV
jgi:GNAT domain-containint protein/N-acyltransferase family protein